MSFFLTTQQMREGSKRVTRRLGWAGIKPGEILRAVVKCQGLKRGERVQTIGFIRVVDVKLELLSRMLIDSEYGKRESVMEGFPEMSGADFVKMFCEHNGCHPERDVNRIEFEFVDKSEAMEWQASHRKKPKKTANS